MSRLTTPSLVLVSIALGGCFNYDYLSRNFDGATPIGDASLPAYALAVLSASPLAYYRFEETSGDDVVDSSGHGLDGVYGSAVAHVAGIVDGSGNAARFPGGNWSMASIITVARNMSLEPSQEVSVEAWVHTSGTAGLSNGFASYGSDAAPHFESYVLQEDVGAGSFYAGDQGVTLPDQLATSSTFHLVGVYSESAVTLYVNGQSASTGPRTGSLGGYDGTHGLAIGATDTSGSDMRTVFPGVIDEVAIYGSALDGATVMHHYQVGTGQ